MKKSSLPLPTTPKSDAGGFPAVKSVRGSRGSRISRLILLAPAFAGCLCGCQILTYTSPSGERFTRGSLGANIALNSLTLESDTNGVRRVELKGYQSDSAQSLSAVTEAAVRAAVQGATK